MAWIFSLSAECGPDQDAATLFTEHFHGLSFDLITSKTSSCHGSIWEDRENNWWAFIYPDNITRSGIVTLDDAIDFSELSFRLYKHLLSAPPFRFAIVGCEVDGFRSYSELPDDVAIYPDGHRELRPFDGLVICEDIWQLLGMPIAFLPFMKGYQWRQYWEGAHYSPVGDHKDYSERLRALRNELPMPTWKPGTLT